MSLITRMSDDDLTSKLVEFTEEVSDLYLTKEIPEIAATPDPLTFYREWIAPNKPVIIKNACHHWPALQKWNHNYLRDLIGDSEVTVTSTPNGYADAPNDTHFLLPHEKSMNFASFLEIIENPNKYDGVHYIQKQNSNLPEEFSELLQDIDEDVPWLTSALGKRPEAVNFWMGDHRAVTSMHKDNFENIYCVVKGYKDFILCPPTDLPWIPYKRYPQARYVQRSNQFSIVPLRNTLTVPWICIDPLKPNLEEFPLYKNASPIHVRLHEGDGLYLPSMWFHHVRQSHGCIAVNYWYDMEYDIKYAYYNLLKSVTWDKKNL